MDKAKRNDIHRRFIYLSSDDVSRKRSFACSVLMGSFHELAMLVEERSARLWRSRWRSPRWRRRPCGP